MPGAQGRRAGRVWIVGDDHWPRAYLRAELIERGYDAVGFVTLHDAAVALAQHRSRPPDLVVVDLQDQPPNPQVVAALARQRIPAIAVTGAAASSWALAGPLRLPLPGWAALLRRPLTIGSIADAVDRLLAGPRAPA